MEVADAQSGFSGPAKAILSLRTGRLGGAGNPLTCRGPISISVSAAPTCNGSGIQVARSDDAPRINGSDAQDRKGTTADQSSAEPWAAPRSYGGTSGAPAVAAVNVGQPSRAFVIAGCVRFCFAGTGVPLLFFKFGGSRACGRARQNGQRFLGAPRAVVCIEAAGSVRCVWGARADAGRRCFPIIVARRASGLRH